jgi:hypothetical protein
MAEKHDHVKKENIRKAADYIKTTKRHGHSDGVIRAKLIEHDYDKDVVEKAFNHVNSHKKKSILLRLLLTICIIVAIYALLKAFMIL